MNVGKRGAALCAATAIGTFGFVPAGAMAAPSDPSSIVINEIVYDGPEGDAVELFNQGSEAIDLGGWSLHDDKDRTGSGDLSGTLEPGEYRVLRQLDDAGNGDFDFGLGKGDSVVLKDASGQTVDEYAYEATAPLAAWGRCPDGTGAWAHVTAITLGAENNCEPVAVPDQPGSIVINEIDSGPADWVEFLNQGDEPLDISGYEIRDNSDDHRWRFPEGSVIEPGDFLVVDAKSEGLIFNDQTGALEPNTFEAAIGIGSGDSIRLYDAAGALLDAYTWVGHASIDGDEAAATLGRVPDGVGTFGLTHATQGAPNKLHTPAIAINEIESNGDATDWVEVINTTTVPVDISGWTVMDNDPVGHASDVVPVPEGTVVEPGATYVFDTGTHFGFGLGSDDTATVRNAEGVTVDEHSWNGHANVTLSRCPDGTGDFVDASASTKNALNACEGEVPIEEGPETLEWPGSQEPTVRDSSPMFFEDSSGLDYANGTLWAVDNGTGTFWKLNAQADGSVAFADGWENGKRARFAKDADSPEAAGPDAEGITIASDGLIYITSERDNSDKGTNFNSILQVDPNAAGPDVVASKEWDLTKQLPEVSANMGIEAVEHVDASLLDGAFTDLETGKPFDSSVYPGAVAGGVFFTALEANGHVYGWVLNDDGTATMVVDIDSTIGGAMGLDFLEDSRTLVVLSDDGFNGVISAISFDTGEPVATLFSRPAGMPNVNNEGFALSSTCTGGSRTAWFFQDGVAEGALTSVQVNCDAFGAPASEAPGTDEPGTDEPDADEPGTDNPGTDESGTDEPSTPEDGKGPKDNEGAQSPGGPTTDKGSHGGQGAKASRGHGQPSASQGGPGHQGSVHRAHRHDQSASSRTPARGNVSAQQSTSGSGHVSTSSAQGGAQSALPRTGVEVSGTIMLAVATTAAGAIAYGIGALMRRRSEH